MNHVALCPKCGKPVDAAQSESWCIGCGTQFSEEIASRLPRFVALREAAALEMAHAQPRTPSRGERIFRGMVGMGTVFGAVGVALIGALAVFTLVVGGGKIDFDDDMDFMLVAPFVGFGIAFGLGMLYGGLLAFLARGRSFREVSLARVAAAGAAIGLIPGLIVAISGLLWGESARDAVDAFALFPPLSAIVATATLLFARRAKPEPDGDPTA